MFYFKISRYTVCLKIVINLSRVQVANYALISAVCSFLQWANHTINFFLYCISGKRFRQELTDMVTHCHHRHRRQPAVVVASQAQHVRAPRRESETSSLSVSLSVCTSEEVHQYSQHPPTNLEDPLSRVSRWTEDNCAHPNGYRGPQVNEFAAGIKEG